MIKLIVTTIVILILWKFTPFIESMPNIIRFFSLIDGKVLLLLFSVVLPGTIFTIVGLYITKQ